eukprot:g80581.t1
MRANKAAAVINKSFSLFYSALGKELFSKHTICDQNSFFCEMSQKFVAKTDGTLFCEYCGCDAPSQVQCRFVPVGPNYTRWVCFAGALFALMVGVFFKTPSGERAFRIIHKDVVLDEAHAPFTFESAWNAFGSEHFQWLESGVYLFWKHHPLALRHLEHNLTVVRVQKSGLCFMHAPATLQHYLLTLYSGNSSAMLDVASFLRYNASWQDLWDHVWSNHGGSSVKFLEDLVNITGKDMVDFPLQTARHFPTTWTTLITDSMKTYGPALVSRFHVTPDFVDQNANDSFLSNSSVDFSTSRGLHAMLLIGFRNVGTSTVFLLQNWWTHMPLVEVSQEYLLAHDPTITFVTANISAITNFYPKVYGQYFETEADVGEGEDLECCL